MTAGIAGTAFAQIPIGPPPPPPPSVPSRVVTVRPTKPLIGPPGVAATVNGVKISTAQVNTLVAPRLDDERRQLSAQATELLINNMLVDQAAKKQGVIVPPAEINARLAQVRQQIGSDPRAQGQTLDALVAKNHETMAQFKESLRLRIAADKLVERSLPPVKMAHVEYLLVATTNPQNNPALKPHSDAEAQKIIAKAQADLASGKSFESVVKQYSEDPSTKDKNGDLGLVGPGSGYAQSFINAALLLHKGEVTATPVYAPQFGYFLIKAVSTSTDPLDAADKAAYATAIAATRQSQLQQALPGYLTNLRQRAKVLDYETP